MEPGTATGSGDRIHRAVSGDGTEIAGRVHGQGPSLVLVHGGAGDGETAWRPLLPFLAGRFTCYTMSTRGRGLSAGHPDHSLERLVEDVTAFAESIGEPVGIVGHSSSLALAAAARTGAIAAVAVYEPAVPALASQDAADEEAAIERMMGAAGENRLEEAARIFCEESGLFNQEEVAALRAAGAYETMAPNVPAWCQEMPEYAGAVDSSVLERVGVPVLLLQGADTAPWFRDSVRYVAARLRDATVVTIPGAGHMGPRLAPEPVARALVPFFTSVHQPGRRETAS
jgi:pimeloyl-ACP methyl ester carboxylesterase